MSGKYNSINGHKYNEITQLLSLVTQTHYTTVTPAESVVSSWTAFLNVFWAEECRRLEKRLGAWLTFSLRQIYVIVLRVYILNTIMIIHHNISEAKSRPTCLV